MSRYDFPIQVPIMVTSDEQLQAVYAVLAGDLRRVPHTPSAGDRPKAATLGSAGNPSPVASTSTLSSDTSNEPTSSPVEEPDSDPNEVDAHGWPWSADLHASTRSQTKEGLWRMKVGVSRPDPKPGFPKTTETPSEISTTSPVSPAASGVTEPAGSSPTEAPASAAASQDDDDEFAAFRAAAAKADATDAAAAANVPPRTYSDADLSSLCNQAAVKLGDPVPVKEIIAAYVPAGEVAHSRHVPQDKRADFVKAIEAKAGIEFAG